MRFEPHLWGVVLSGGEGVRLKALTRQICGDERPKNVPIFGNRTLLRQTLDRVALRIRPSRTAVVTLRSHSRFFGEHWAGPEPPRVLISQRTVGPPRGSSSQSTGSPARIPTRSSPSFLRITSCRSRRPSWRPSRELLPGSTSTLPGWCCSVLTQPAPRSSTAGSSSDDRWTRGMVDRCGRSAGSGRSPRRSGRAYVWKRAVSGTRSSWWARPPRFSAPLGRRFQKSASAWPGPCPSSKAMRKPGLRRLP